MLTITGLASAKYLTDSVALGVEEYYLGVGEAPGVWAGSWAGGLGLEGVVEADHLARLVDGCDPHTGESLVPGMRERSVKAWDLTFSAPKSVSLLWALGDDATAHAVAAAHREAVEAGVQFLERHAAWARRQEHGVRTRVATDGLVVAGFVHRTSRAGDPQLHTHCLVPNLVRRAEDGKVVALDATPLYGWVRAAGCVYQNHLQGLLAERLLVAWGPDRTAPASWSVCPGASCGCSPSEPPPSRVSSQRLGWTTCPAPRAWRPTTPPPSPPAPPRTTGRPRRC